MIQKSTSLKYEPSPLNGTPPVTAKHAAKLTPELEPFDEVVAAGLAAARREDDFKPHWCTQHPEPCTLHPTPYTLHPTPYTLHPTPYTLHPTSYTLHPTPNTLNPAPYALHPQPYTLKGFFFFFINLQPLER